MRYCETKAFCFCETKGVVCGNALPLCFVAFTMDCSVAVLDAAPGVLRSIGELVPAALTHWQQ